MDNPKFREYADTQRIITPVTLARWAAMTAGEEWLGYVQYQLAMTAAIEAHHASSDADAAVAAGQLYTNMKELPTSDMPASSAAGEQAWNAARTLFALASDLSEAQADTQLREDFRYYMFLIRGYLSDSGNIASSQTNWLVGLMLFASIDCGADPASVVSMLQTRHSQYDDR